VKAVSKKICLLGDLAVGKTSLTRRFVYDLFDERHTISMGVKVTRKTVAVPTVDGVVVELSMMLWDLGDSADFDQMRGSYLRGAAGAILVCDLTRPESLRNLDGYLAELHHFSPKAVVVLAANKSDCPARALPLSQVHEVATRMGGSHFLTSACTGENVDEMFRSLGRMLVDLL